MAHLINIGSENVIQVKRDERNTLLLRLLIPVFKDDSIAPHHYSRVWIAFHETKRKLHFLAAPDKYDHAYIISIDEAERAQKAWSGLSENVNALPTCAAQVADNSNP